MRPKTSEPFVLTVRCKGCASTERIEGRGGHGSMTIAEVFHERGWRCTSPPHQHWCPQCAPVVGA